MEIVMCIVMCNVYFVKMDQSDINYWFIGLVAAVSLLIWYLKKTYSFWSSQGVYQFSTVWGLGNLGPVLTGKIPLSILFCNYYEELRRKGKRCGGGYLFIKPVLVLSDLQLVKQICTTDFQYFDSHGAFFNEDVDPLTAHLFNLEGAPWKNMRTKLTPTFTSGKMKMMFSTIQNCSNGFKDMMESYVKSKEPVEIKDILGRFTTDVIGNCAFGIDCNSIKDPDTEFRQYGKKVFDSASKRALLQFASTAMPAFLHKIFKIKLTPSDIESFFIKVVEDTVNFREKNNVVRNDFMHLMLQLKNKGTISDQNDGLEHSGKNDHSKISMNELYAQAFVFFAAGFETSSTAMTFALLELSLNQDIQNKLRDDINRVLAKYNGEVTYDAVMEMKYLDMVLNESLRKHAPAMSIPRACTKDYVIPGTSINIKKGTNIIIPILAIHRDPEYYPDPDKFDPERFTEENKAKRPTLAFMPFGEGPRTCIGLRFGVLQAKIGLIALLRNYRFTRNDKTKLPIESDPHSLINTVKGGVWLNVARV